MCMKNLNKNDPFFLFYTVSHFIGLNRQKHVTTQPHNTKSPRGEDGKVGAVQTGVQFGGDFL